MNNSNNRIVGLAVAVLAAVSSFVGYGEDMLAKVVERYYVTETRTARNFSNGFFNDVRAKGNEILSADCLMAWKLGDESQALKVKAGKNPINLSFVSSGLIAAYTRDGALAVTRGKDGRFSVTVPGERDTLITRVIPWPSRFPRDKFMIQACYFRPETVENADWAQDCGIDFFWDVPAQSRETIDMLKARGIGSITIDRRIRWCGGMGKNAGLMRTQKPFTNFVAVAEDLKTKNQEGIYAVDVCDEPNAKDIPYIGEMCHYLWDHLNRVEPMMSLYPIYAQLEETSKRAYSQLGTKTYDEYIETYCNNVPLSYIDYDIYVIYRDAKKQAEMVEKFYKNMDVVSRFMRRTGRTLWAALQANSHKNEPDYFTSINQLRFQANSSMAYGATCVEWACYGRGWWTNQIVEATGKTEQFDKVKQVNAELHAVGQKFIQYRNVATHLVGMPKHGNLASVDTPFAKGIRLAEGTPLLVGEMVARDPKCPSLALYLVPQGDHHDETKAVRTVAIAAVGARRVAVTRSDGQPIAAKRAANGSLSFPLPENYGALVEFIVDPSVRGNLVRDEAQSEVLKDLFRKSRGVK